MEANTYIPASEFITLDITNNVGIFDNKIVIGPIYNQDQMTLNLIIHELQSDGDIVLGMDHAITSNISMPLPFLFANYTSICTKNYCVVTTIDPYFWIATRIFVINLENGTHTEHIIYDIKLFGYGIVDDRLYLASNLITDMGRIQGIRTFYMMDLITSGIYPSSSHYISGHTTPGIADTYLGTVLFNRGLNCITQVISIPDGKTILNIGNEDEEYPFLAYDGVYYAYSDAIWFRNYNGESYRAISFEDDPMYQELVDEPPKVLFSDSLRGELWILVYQDETNRTGYFRKYRIEGRNRRDKLTKNATTVGQRPS